MQSVDIHKNVNYPGLRDILAFLQEVPSYFRRYKGVVEFKLDEIEEVRTMLRLVEKANAIIYHEIELVRPSVLSKNDLAKATGIPRATFFRSLKKRSISQEDLRTICMLLIDPALKDEFIFIADMEKFIESKREENRDFLWIYFQSIYLDREKSPFYKIDFRNSDQVIKAIENLQAQCDTKLARLKVELAGKQKASGHSRGSPTKWDSTSRRIN